MTIEDLINNLIENRNIETNDLKSCFAEFCDGVPYPPEQLAALLALLRARGETSEQLAGTAETFLERAITIDMPEASVCLVGTGGDGTGTFNISTTASLLVAACGVPVPKHGSRSVTSKCGSADVLEELGIATDLGPEKAAYSLKNYGFTFLFAQTYHPAFQYISPIRKALKVRTMFNIMGPLLHPGNVKRQVVGVFDLKLISVVAGALSALGHIKTMVVCSEDGLDEISLTGLTHAKLVEGDSISDLTINPEDYGFTLCSIADLKGGDARENAQITRDIFAGGKGPKSDIVVLNSGIALYLSGKVDSIEEGIEMARPVQESGKALEFIERLKEVK
ncbi:MAG: anthranilate phosphoribosyltransferase [Gammaproteobacteria bacterium]